MILVGRIFWTFVTILLMIPIPGLFVWMYHCIKIWSEDMILAFILSALNIVVFLLALYMCLETWLAPDFYLKSLI